jgi:hypothetical protein
MDLHFAGFVAFQFFCQVHLWTLCIGKNLKNFAFFDIKGLTEI